MNISIVLMIVLVLTQAALFLVMLYQFKKLAHFKRHVDGLFGHYEQSILDYWKKIVEIEKQVTPKKPVDPRLLRGRTQ